MAIEFLSMVDGTGVTRKVAVDLFNIDQYAQVMKLGYGPDGATPSMVDDPTGLPVRLQATSNLAGKFDANSVPAMDLTTDSAAVARRSRVIVIGGTVYPVTLVGINLATSGDHTLVAAQGASKVIRVISWWLFAGGTVTATFASGAGTGTPLPGPLPLTAQTGIVAGRNEDGALPDTAANALLNLNLSVGSVQVTGLIGYIVV